MNTARQANHHAPHSNLTEMYPGVYRPGSGSNSDGDDGPNLLNLPTGPLNTLLGFELETYQIPLDQLLPSKKVYEVLHHYLPQIQASNALSRLGLQPEQYFVVSAHREENIESDKSFAKLVAVLNALAEDHGLPVVVSTHPRTQKRVDATGAQFHPLVRLMKPLGFHDYVNLQMQARAVLSDSGTINEESSILNFPALNLREAHERPEGMEEAAVMMVGLEVERVRQGLSILATQPRGADRNLRLVADYSMPNVSDKVVRIIHSYTDYVNRVVWKKY